MICTMKKMIWLRLLRSIRFKEIFQTWKFDEKSCDMFERDSRSTGRCTELNSYISVTLGSKATTISSFEQNPKRISSSPAMRNSANVRFRRGYKYFFLNRILLSFGCEKKAKISNRNVHDYESLDVRKFFHLPFFSLEDELINSPERNCSMLCRHDFRLTCRNLPHQWQRYPSLMCALEMIPINVH